MFAPHSGLDDAAGSRKFLVTRLVERMAGASDKPIGLTTHGQVAQEDVGSLPLRLRFEAELCWRQRSVELCWQQQPGRGAESGDPRARGAVSSCSSRG